MPEQTVAPERLLGALDEGARTDRRGFVRGMAAAGMLAALGLQGCASEEQPAGIEFVPAQAPLRLRAAFSHNGLGTIWNQRGSETAKFLGGLLGVDVVSYDGELSIDKQRQDLEAIGDQDWDFVVIHPLAANAYDEQVRRIVRRGIPVIDIDTRLADNLGELGVATFLEPDNLQLAEHVAGALIDAARGERFEIVHTQGLLTHSGAQRRAQGFNNVVRRHPGVTVVDDSACDWSIDKVTALWDDLLERHPDIRAGFFHNDEMALAALRSIKRAGREGQILVAGIDGMQPACAAVAEGQMVATALNPTGRIHGGALWAGYYLATKGERANVPPFIRIDGGLIDRDSAAGFIWQGDHLLV